LGLVDELLYQTLPKGEGYSLRLSYGRKLLTQQGIFNVGSPPLEGLGVVKNMICNEMFLI
jgi:hypothetical protein